MLITVSGSVKKSEFTFRESVIEDASEIAQVNYLTWILTYRGLVPNSELDSLSLESLTDRWKQNLSSANPKNRTFVVLSGASVIAYSRFYPSVDPDDDPNRVATIGSIYISPEFQRKGLGRKLMAAVLEAAKSHGFTEATLHVLAANERARAFYESLSWEMDLDADIGVSDEESVPKVRYRRNPL